MNDSLKNRLVLPPDAELTPVAACFSGDSVFSLLVKAELKEKTFFTILSGPEFQPSGWTEDETIIDPLITKHDFVLFSPEDNPPVLTSTMIWEGKKKLEEWWKNKNIRS